jgi:coenzyme F420-0:L-glutamate ligase/coenzyme F420-1:gamma-L-glutamate ligase
MNPSEVRILSLPGLPVIVPGTDLAALICDAAENAGITLQADDILVVTQKIVSKAEGSLVDLTEVEPSPLAQRFAKQWDKDARLVEVVLHQSRRIVKMDRGVLIT